MRDGLILIILYVVAAEDPNPVVFAINKNLFVLVKIVNCKYLLVVYSLFKEGYDIHKQTMK